MTVTTTTAEVVLTGDGILKTFNLGFEVAAADTLVVYLRDDTALSRTLQVLNVDYTLASLDMDAGATITLLAGTAIPSTQAIECARVTPNVQGSTLLTQSGFSPIALDARVDILTKLVQELKEKTDRAVLIPAGLATPLPLNFSDSPAGKFLTFDASWVPGIGEPVASAVTFSAFGTTFVNLASVAAAQQNMSVEPGVDLEVYNKSNTNSRRLHITAGSSTVYTLTSTVPIIAYATGQTWLAVFHTTFGAAPTINIDTIGAKTLKVLDAAGVKENPASTDTIQGGMVVLLEYDGTDIIAHNRIGTINRAGMLKVLANTTLKSSTLWPVTEAVVDINTSYRLLARKVASASAELAFTEFNSTLYDDYIFRFHNLIPATDAALLEFQTSSDGGSGYDSDAGDYQQVYQVTAETTVSASNINGTTNRITNVHGIGNAAGEAGLVGELRLFSPHLIKKTKFIGDVGWTQDTGATAAQRAVLGFIHGERDEAAIVDAIKFFMSTGNMASGFISMYGIRNDTAGP